jgi:hypothetical protein
MYRSPLLAGCTLECAANIREYNKELLECTSLARSTCSPKTFLVYESVKSGYDQEASKKMSGKEGIESSGRGSNPLIPKYNMSDRRTYVPVTGIS